MDRGDLASGWGRVSCKNLSVAATELHTLTCSCSKCGFSGIWAGHRCSAGGRALLRPYLKLVLTSVLSLALKLTGPYKGSQQPIASHLAKKMGKQKEQKNSVFRVFSRQLQNYHKAKKLAKYRLGSKLFRPSKANCKYKWVNKKNRWLWKKERNPLCTEEGGGGNVRTYFLI